MFITYLCCLADPLAGAKRWAPGTLLLPPCHGRGRRGTCGCVGSGLSSCVCCWWPRCLMGLTGEPAAHHWTGYPEPERTEASLEYRWYNLIIWMKQTVIKLCKWPYDLPCGTSRWRHGGTLPNYLQLLFSGYYQPYGVKGTVHPRHKKDIFSFRAIYSLEIM